MLIKSIHESFNEQDIAWIHSQEHHSTMILKVDDQFRAMYEVHQRADYDTSQVVCETYASVPSSSQWQIAAIAACWVGPESCR